MIVTPNRSLSKEVEDLLNEQIRMEGQSSAYYLSMASWCETQGYEHSAQFLYQHSEEERGHMLKLFQYVNEAGGHALQPEVTDIKHSFKSLREVFEATLEHEINVTNSIHEIVDKCLASKDYTSFNFLQWYVAEQHEEETLFKSVLDKINLVGHDGHALFFVDKDLAAMAKNDAVPASIMSDSNA